MCRRHGLKSDAARDGVGDFFCAALGVRALSKGGGLAAVRLGDGLKRDGVRDGIDDCCLAGAGVRID